MATINFLYRSIKEETFLTVRLLFRNEDLDYVFGTSTKYTVSKFYWSKQHKIKKPKDLDVVNKQHEVNNELNKIEKHILTAFNNAKVDVVNKKWLQDQVDLYYNPPAKAIQLPTDLIEYFDKYLEYKKNEITVNTEKKINVIKQLLIRYVADTKKTLNLTDVDGDFKMNFESYCSKNFYSANTVSVALKYIKTICYHAKSNGQLISDKISNIKIKHTKVDNIYLTFGDLNKIQNCKSKKLTESLLNARDWLIISCYTGQRISDFMRFTDKQIRTEKGEKLIEFSQLKTGKNMTIPLHHKVWDILEARGGQFPKAISDQKYNEYIKKVCEISKINKVVLGSKKSETQVDSGIYRKKTDSFKKWELVTSHIGRRSFASNFYGNVPTSFLIYVTGHSTESLFLTYINKGNKDIAMELVKYFNSNKFKSI